MQASDSSIYGSVVTTTYNLQSRARRAELVEKIHVNSIMHLWTSKGNLFASHLDFYRIRCEKCAAQRKWRVHIENNVKMASPCESSLVAIVRQRDFAPQWSSDMFGLSIKGWWKKSAHRNAATIEKQTSDGHTSFSIHSSFSQARVCVTIGRRETF